MSTQQRTHASTSGVAAAGMVWQKQVGPFDGNRLYLRKDVAAFLPKYDIHDWRAPFEPSQES